MPGAAQKVSSEFVRMIAIFLLNFSDRFGIINMMYTIVKSDKRNYNRMIR